MMRVIEMVSMLMMMLMLVCRRHHCCDAREAGVFLTRPWAH